MNTCLECLPCFLSQALRAARITTDDEIKIRETLDEIGLMIT
jgi:damage-control phosphatase, subfamily I